MADEATATTAAAQPAVAVDPAPEAATIPAVAGTEDGGAVATTPPAASLDPRAGAGTATPALSDAGTATLSPGQQSLSLKVSLADLSAKATALYARKNYDGAAEVYARAAEMQAEMNGEMSPDNAEILFLYGRSLFRVGQSKSDVLGGRAPDAQPQGRPRSKAANARRALALEEGPPLGEDELTVQAIAGPYQKPLFQFTGDENLDDSDSDEEEEEGGEAEEADEEADDDLAVAFEILDLARVLFNKKLDQLGEAEAGGGGKGKEEAEGEAGADGLAARHIKERLADTHDLLAEISLENERYPNAIVDSRQSLRYKKELYPEESEIIAEAHFKLSLALEFASVTSSAEDENDGAKPSGPKPVDQGLRDEAADELEAAIQSTRLKLQKKEVDLVVMHSPEDNEHTRRQIVEVKDVIADMEQRLVDLRKPPIDVNAALYGPAGIASGGNPAGGILGAVLGEPSAQAEARLEEAKKTANDLTGLVRKKHRDEPRPAAPAPVAAPAPAPAPAAEANGGKRKADEPVEAEAEAKKAKVEGGEAAEA